MDGFWLVLHQGSQELLGDNHCQLQHSRCWCLDGGCPEHHHTANDEQSLVYRIYLGPFYSGDRYPVCMTFTSLFKLGNVFEALLTLGPLNKGSRSQEQKSVFANKKVLVSNSQLSIDDKFNKLGIYKDLKDYKQPTAFRCMREL